MEQANGNGALPAHSLDDLKAGETIGQHDDLLHSTRLTVQLRLVLKDTLEARGSLGQIKARIRAEIFSALDDHTVPKPKLSNENLIINELIREYLEYNGYRHAHSVFLAESGQPVNPPFHRDFLAKELHVREDQRSHVPMLYGIVNSLQRSSADDGDPQRHRLSREQQQGQQDGDNDDGDDKEENLLPQSHSPDNAAYISTTRGTEPSPLVFRK
ncbi:hypothetical protein P43SY_008788 [Pythium insidiosum]|uniref:Centrosomal protein 20 n=1 Tax=Pythium insidiosum TaxID=114742 RepID=A0AAD5M752_PYTIN|nr:hypothetical protein P43SY_008788 [Pythium insidiosum]